MHFWHSRLIFGFVCNLACAALISMLQLVLESHFQEAAWRCMQTMIPWGVLLELLARAQTLAPDACTNPIRDSAQP